MSLETDKMVFLEVQKTGSTFVNVVLEKCSLDVYRGSKKHHRVEPQAIGDRLVLASVRNPWSWYVSLWAYGMQGNGAVRIRSTERKRGTPGSGARKREWLLHRAVQPFKQVDAFQEVYSEATPENFQRWVRLLHRRRTRIALGERWAASPLSGWAGLFTWRYLYLLARDREGLFARELRKPAGLQRFLEEGLLEHHLMRNESLGPDLVEGLTRAGHTLTEQDLALFLRRKRTNTSQRRPALAYYDEATLDYVADLDRVLIEHFGYERPRLDG